MEYFDNVLALARIALNGDEKRVLNQIERLRDELKKSDPKQAEKLSRLLSRNEQRQDVAPMSLQQMRAQGEKLGLSLPGENLSRSTPLPVDKETAAPLVRIVFPEDKKEAAPILNKELEAAINDLLKEWERVDELAAIGVQPNMRCLIYGAPGVGKTLLARFIAQRLGLPLVEARLDGLVSSFLGTTARNIGALFDFADRYRCILFLDEFDAIAKARDDNQEVGEIKRVVNTLLQSLDARSTHGFTLAATNHEHLLDAAVWRRFEARIEIPKPDSIGRESILTRFLEPVRLTPKEMAMLVWLTEGMSGADLETLVAGGKRYFVLHNGATSSSEKKGNWQKDERQEALLSALRRQATLNARLFDGRRQALLLGPDENLLDAIIDGAGLTQRDAAELLGISQSTVSRMRKTGANEKVNEEDQKG